MGLKTVLDKSWRAWYAIYTCVQGFLFARIFTG